MNTAYYVNLLLYRLLLYVMVFFSTAFVVNFKVWWLLTDFCFAKTVIDFHLVYHSIPIE